MKELKFLKCKHCQILVEVIHSEDIPVICCGEPMEELVPNIAEASSEKHLPAVCVEDQKVCVKIGSLPHPMVEEHHIEFICLETENGVQRKCLKVDEDAAACFSVLEDKPVAVYAYCNLHGLWKTDAFAFCSSSEGSK